MLAQSPQGKKTIGELTPDFLIYVEVERGFSKETIVKYRDCMRQVQKVLGARASSGTIGSLVALLFH
jgi:site-specific recombinase XerD